MAPGIYIAIPEDFLLPNAPTSYAYHIYRDGTPLPRPIARGLHGVVIVEDGGATVVKVPFLQMIVDNGRKFESDRNKLTPSLESERLVYERLKGTTGIARYLGPVGEGFRLEYYPHGNLQQYVYERPEASMHQKRRWVIEIVELLARCHEARVLVYDVSLRNFVLDKEDKVHLIDFAGSLLQPLDTNMNELCDLGCSVKLDMLHLGVVIYGLGIWSDFDIDCGVEEEWPDPASLPSTAGVLYGSIIRACWEGRYRNIGELQRELHHPKSRRNARAKANRQSLSFEAKPSQISAKHHPPLANK